jgi:Fe-S-cluster containining protein
MNTPQRMYAGVDINTRRTDHHLYLAQEENKHLKRARNVGKKDCQQCGFCCLKQPCVPTPYEFARIADYLKTTPRELAENYAVVNECKDGFYILWARETQTDVLGQCLPYYRTFDKGYCMFFNKNDHTCEIHPVRPRTAQETECWKNRQPSYGAAWTTEQIRSLLPGFNPNSGDLYVVNSEGAVNLLRV